MPVNHAPTDVQADQAQRVRAQEAAVRAAERNDRPAGAGRGSPGTDGQAGEQTGARPQGKAVGHHHGPPPQGKQDYTFADALDVVNPLQHIPGVSAAYQEATGDEIKSAPQVAGDILYGGIPGLLGGAASAIVEEATGDSLGGHAMAAVGLKEPETEPATRLARQDGGPAGQASREASITRTASTTKTVELATTNSQPGTGAGGERADTTQQSERGVHLAAATAGGDAPRATTTAANGAPATGDDALNALAQDLRQGGSAGQASTPQRAAEAADAEPQAARTDGRASADTGVARGDAALSQLANDLRQGGQPRDAQQQASRAANDGARRSEPGATQTARATDAPADSEFFEIRDKHYTNAAEQNARDAAQRLQAEATTEEVPGRDMDASAAYTGTGSNTDTPAERGDGAGGQTLPNPDTDGMPENFADRMKNALDKYRAMQQAQ